MKHVTLMLISVTLCLVEAEPATVSMRLRSDGLTKAWIYIKFYGETFTQFYNCLSRNISLICSAELTRDRKQLLNVFDKRVVDVHKQEAVDKGDGLSDYFSCKYVFPDDQFSCIRLQSADVKCSSRTITQHFRLFNNSTVSSSCVTIIWDSQGESIIFKNRTGVVSCNRTCISPPKNDFRTQNHISPTHVPNSTHPAHLTVQHVPDDDNSFRNRPRHPIDDDLDNKTHIILAVVIALSVAAILVIAAAFFRRKLLQNKTPPKSDDTFNNVVSGRKKSNRSRKISIEMPAKSTSVILDPSMLNTDI